MGQGQHRPRDHVYGVLAVARGQVEEATWSDASGHPGGWSRLSCGQRCAAGVRVAQRSPANAVPRGRPYLPRWRARRLCQPAPSHLADARRERTIQAVEETRCCRCSDAECPRRPSERPCGDTFVSSGPRTSPQPGRHTAGKVDATRGTHARIATAGRAITGTSVGRRSRTCFAGCGRCSPASGRGG